MTSLEDTNMNTTMNTNKLPDILIYFMICAIEQRGKHTLGCTTEDFRLGNENDLNFLNSYINFCFQKEFKDEEIKFINDFLEFMKSKLEVHLTRDCQIIETGHHYVRLTYISNNNCIKFYIKFKQKFNTLPETPDILNVQHFTIDNIYNIIVRVSFNKDDKILYELPCSYLIENRLEINPKLTPDACIII